MPRPDPQPADLLTFRSGMGFDSTTGAQPVIEAAAELELGAGPRRRPGRPSRTSGCGGWAPCPCPANPASAGSTTPAPTCWACWWRRWRAASPRCWPSGCSGRWAWPTPDSTCHRPRSTASAPVTSALPAARCTTPRTASGAGRPPSRAAGRAWCPRWTISWPSPPCCTTAAPTAGTGSCARPTVEAMTTNTSPRPARHRGARPGQVPRLGFGLAVQVARTGPARSVGSYGWDGGLGSSWANDPAEDLIGVILTDQAWGPRGPVPVPGLLDLHPARPGRLGPDRPMSTVDANGVAWDRVLR